MEENDGMRWETLEQSWPQVCNFVEGTATWYDQKIFTDAPILLQPCNVCLLMHIMQYPAHSCPSARIQTPIFLNSRFDDISTWRYACRLLGLCKSREPRQRGSVAQSGGDAFCMYVCLYAGRHVCR